jgi:hypothetical protein
MRRAHRKKSAMVPRLPLLGAACLLLATADAAASDNVLRKCVAADGSVSYQNTSCAADAQVWARPFEPAADEGQREPPRQSSASTRNADTVSTSRAGSAPSERDRRAAACRSAKAHRKQTLDAVGLRRTYELLSRLDREVAAACKGVDR